MPSDQQQQSALITKKIIPKLTTFPIRGKAEPIRMMLEDNGNVFGDILKIQSTLHTRNHI